MYAVTTRFLEAVRGSRKDVSWVEVLQGDEVAYVLEPVSGDVTIAARSSIRRSFDGSFADPDGDLTPNDAADLLMPFGTELRAWRGIEWRDGTVEAASLGIFRLTETDVSHDDERGIRITLAGYDRAHRIQSPLTRPLAFPAGTLLEDAILGLVETRYPGVASRFTPTGWVTPALLFSEQEDPWRRAGELAASAGLDLYFDADGVLVLAPVPTAAAQVTNVWRYATGEANILTSFGRRWRSDDVPNGIIVTGEHSSLSVQVRGEAWDLDPKSPTFRGGAYGERPDYRRSLYATTPEQAAAQAFGDLHRALGISHELRFDAVVNPAHDVGDFILVEDAPTRLDNVYVIDRLTVPLLPTDGMGGLGRSLPSLAAST